MKALSCGKIGENVMEWGFIPNGRLGVFAQAIQLSWNSFPLNFGICTFILYF